jgi:hypothetical protein
MTLFNKEVVFVDASSLKDKQQRKILIENPYVSSRIEKKVPLLAQP